MSQRHFPELLDSPLSSGDEEKLVIDEKPQKGKRPAKIKRHVPVQPISEDEDDYPVASTSSAVSIKRPRNENVEDQFSKIKKKPTTQTTPITKPPSMYKPIMLDKNEQKWQQAMDITVAMLSPLKVDTKDITLLPDSNTLDYFKKAAQAYINEKKLSIVPTFSSHKSIQTVIARFLFEFVLRTVGIITNYGFTMGDSSFNWSPSGCAAWNHHCDESLFCLHGLQMINKEQIFEMDISSENAQKALKENPDRAKITSNRFGRNIVQLKNEDAVCCIHDANSAPNTFSLKSCGMFYSESKKALQAFRQIMAFQKACYPKMPNADSLLLMPIKCECNWPLNPVPILGRQICKITPFNVNSTAGIERAALDDPRLRATVDHPSILVFQCCNPVYRNTRANPQKNCDFKISATDMISALQIAKKIWVHYNSTPPPIMIPEFKWGPQFQVQNTILPTSHDDDDECLF